MTGGMAVSIFPDVPVFGVGGGMSGGAGIAMATCAGIGVPNASPPKDCGRTGANVFGQSGRGMDFHAV